MAAVASTLLIRPAQGKASGASDDADPINPVGNNIKLPD